MGGVAKLNSGVGNGRKRVKKGGGNGKGEKKCTKEGQRKKKKKKTDVSPPMVDFVSHLVRPPR